MRTALLLLMIALLHSTAFGQDAGRSKPSEGIQRLPITEQRITELHITRSTPKRPEIALQRALKIAEAYVKKQKIDTSSYYLAEAKLIHATRDSEEPYWWFMWIGVRKPVGDYIDITVSMKGKAYRLPSM
jgi:hypothetical protein